MANELLRAKVKAAKEAISAAENDLHEIIGNIAVVARAEKAQVSEAVQAASARLSTARVTLDELEESVAHARLEAARAAISDAEKYLDKVLSEIVVVPEADTQWVSKVVKDAFTKLNIANTTLADLESNVTDTD